MVRIPEVYESGFINFAQLDEKSSLEIAKLIHEIPVGTSLITFYALFQEKTSIKEHQFDIASMVYSLGNFFYRKDSSDKFSKEELIEAFSYLDHENIKKLIPSFKRNIDLILSFGIENLKLTAKAIDLKTENDKNYKESRIITDLRMIFNEDWTTESFNSAVIIHNFNFSYFTPENQSMKNIFLTLDSADLKDLKNKIERAIAKESELKKKVDSIITIIETNQ